MPGWQLNKKQEKVLQTCYDCGEKLWTDAHAGERFCGNPVCSQYVNPLQRELERKGS